MTNEDVIEGKVKQVQGKAGAPKGDITGSTEDKVDGNLKQVEGKIQEGFGKAKEAVKNAINDAK